MNTCISRETLQLVGPSCAELAAGWSLLALDQLNLDPSCPFLGGNASVGINARTNKKYVSEVQILLHPPRWRP